MSDNRVEGQELKALIKIARKGPLGFAFNPGKTDAEHYLAIHRKRSGDILGKEAKKDGPGDKVAFGSCIVEDMTMQLTCDRVIPAIAKKLKKYLKSQKVNLNVEVLDADGNVLESDIEEMPDDADNAEEGQEAAAPVTDAKAPEDDAAEAVNPADQAALIGRIKAAQAGIAGVPEAVGAKLSGALAQVVAQIKAQDLGPASSSLGKIEAAIVKYSEAASPANAAQDQKDAAPAPEQKPAQDQAALVARVKAISAQFAALPPEAVQKLQAAVKSVVDQIKAQNLDVAATTLDRVEGAISKLLGAQPAPANTAPENEAAAPVEGADAGDDPLVIWRDTKESIDEGISLLQTQLKSHAHPDMRNIAELGLNGITQGNQAAMMKALMEFNKAPADQKSTAADNLLGQVETYRGFIKSNKVIALCENNPFGIDVSVVAPVNAALDRITRAARP